LFAKRAKTVVERVFRAAKWLEHRYRSRIGRCASRGTNASVHGEPRGNAVAHGKGGDPVPHPTSHDSITGGIPGDSMARGVADVSSANGGFWRRRSARSVVTSAL